MWGKSYVTDEWQADQARAYGEELRAEGERLRAELADLPAGQRQFVAGDELQGFDRRDWLQARLHAVDQTAGQAHDLQREAEAKIERQGSTGAKAPTEETAWVAKWDTPERRAALRERLQQANVSVDAARARLLTDRAQGLPPQAATWRPPHGTPVVVQRRPPTLAQARQRARTR